MEFYEQNCICCFGFLWSLFVTGWMGKNHFAGITVGVYGLVLLMAAIPYYILQQLIIKNQGPDSILKKATGVNWIPHKNLNPNLFNN